MFETVVPETFAPRSRKVFYETLPVSIALHAIAVVGILAFSVWQVSFPDESPKLNMLYQLVAELPSPPPPPPPPAAPPKNAQVAPVKPVEVPPDEIVAPTIIPDLIPTQQLPVVTEPVQGIAEGVEGGVEGGMAGGSVGGVTGGDIGGEIGGVVGSLAIVPPNTVVVERDKPLPMVAMSKVYPQYPEEARVRGWEDQVIVRYIIGKDGRVRDVIILGAPERQMFTEATVKAIRHWRFRPMIKEGQAQEVIHELTVYFRLES